MKNRTKNILSFMLAFIMVLSVSINVFAAEEQPVDSRFLPQVNYVEDNQIARVPNAKMCIRDRMKSMLQLGQQ